MNTKFYPINKLITRKLNLNTDVLQVLINFFLMQNHFNDKTIVAIVISY
jgi:hypothetical protein